MALAKEDVTLTIPAGRLSSCMVRFKNQQLRLEVQSQWAFAVLQTIFGQGYFT